MRTKYKVLAFLSAVRLATSVAEAQELPTPWATTHLIDNTAVAMDAAQACIGQRLSLNKSAVEISFSDAQLVNYRGRDANEERLSTTVKAKINMLDGSEIFLSATADEAAPRHPDTPTGGLTVEGGLYRQAGPNVERLSLSESYLENGAIVAEKSVAHNAPRIKISGNFLWLSWATTPLDSVTQQIISPSRGLSLLFGTARACLLKQNSI